MRVVLVDHTSTVSGAQHALIELAANMPAGIEVALASPPGDLAARAAELGLPWTGLRGTSASFRLDPLHTPRALADLAISAIQLRRLARGYDLVHANSSRAGLIAAAAQIIGAPPFLVQLHDTPRPGLLAGTIDRVLCNRAAIVLAISRHVAAGLDTRCPVEIVLNPLDLARLEPGGLGRARARSRLGLGPGTELLAIIGQITPWKAQDDAIRILAALTAGHPSAELLVVGSAKFVDRATGFDNAAYAKSLPALAADLGVGSRVHFLGERDDVSGLLEAVDVLLVPSLDEPLGRAMLEGMAMGLPVVATAVGGPSEMIDDGLTGRLVRPGAIHEWAAVVGGLLERPEAAREMGARARAAVAHLDARDYSARIAAIYEAALGHGSRRGASVAAP